MIGRRRFLRPKIWAWIGAIASVGLWTSPVLAAPPPNGLGTAFDREVESILATSGAPSASIAVIVEDQPVWAKSYGAARVRPRADARLTTRYGVGSVSKQFTAAALLMLQSQGKLSLDDPVSRWLPGLTAADRITVRQLLTHTAGYPDFYPEDYTPTTLRGPTTPDAILAAWAKKPLNFQPGDAWQYSNTGYVVAGRIVERITGQPLFAVLKTMIFDPLGMSGVVDNDAKRIATPDATGYARAALGPVREVEAEGPGWMFGAGELAMPASDLARWDRSLIDRSLLSEDAYRQETTTMPLRSGEDSGYALGLFVSRPGGRALYEHSGEIAGFTSENRVYPDDKTAIVVLANLEATNAAALIADRIADHVLAPDAVDRLVSAMFMGLQKGDLDRSRLAPNLSDYFTVQTVRDFSASLGSLGAPRRIHRRSVSRRGGMEHRSYEVSLDARSLVISVYVTPDGRLEQFLVSPEP